MMNILADKGVLDVTDPLTKYFEDFDPVNPYDTEKGASAVTLESLASQTSGLMRETPCGFVGECTEELALSLGNIIPLLNCPLSRPHYSNFGFNLLGHACAKAAGADDNYEQWIVDNILTPFNMSSSGFDYPEEVKEKMAVGCLFLYH